LHADRGFTDLIDRTDGPGTNAVAPEASQPSSSDATAALMVCVIIIHRYKTINRDIAFKPPLVLIGRAIVASQPEPARCARLHTLI
jgi:hypothetical protein